jgi:lipoprotein-anchoring transpeptidase ErfK/SrfK
MQYNSQSSKTYILNWRRAAQSLLLIVLVSSLIVASAQSQASPKRGVTPEPRPAPEIKRAVKLKPLTAKDHRTAEQHLADLGYWTGRIDGRWDNVSRHALIAFQKVEGFKPTGRFTRVQYDALLNASRPTPRETGPAHIEIDLIRQVLFVVDEAGTVTRILPVSSGSGKVFISKGWARDAVTHPGRYKVFEKIAGWKKSPLGRLYYPVYFMVGTAVHGYPSVPTKPASHGCVRIPMFAAKAIHRSTAIGTPVIVYKQLTPTSDGPSPDLK